MKQEIIWKITSISEKGTENPIDTPVAFERMSKRYLMYSAIQGRGAVLVNADNQKEVLKTSTVEEIFLFENSIRLTTLNTVYWLKQSIEDVK